MKTFILKGKGNIPDVPFQLNDLLPLPHEKRYDFYELVKLIDNSKYFTDTNWKITDYEALYQKYENKGTDFFTIRDTGIVVIPGTYIYPTILNENLIR